MKNDGKNIKTFCWKIAGEAGAGIKVTGMMFSKACSRAGLQIFDYSEYPSLIRGGHNTYQVNVGLEEVFSPKYEVDLLVALNQATIDLHKNELGAGAGIIYDNEDKKINVAGINKKTLLLPVPLARLAEEAGGKKLMANSVALGSSFGILNLDFKFLKSIIADAFKRKGDAVVDSNVKIAESGYHYAKNNFSKIKYTHKLSDVKSPPRMLLTASEAIAMAALKAGCKFFSAYPMTPATPILHYLANMEKKFNIVVKQTEDEISALTMAIGAGYAGVRAMTATSGGGFSLMTEALGLAGMTETPVVIVEVQRPGPATGMPTWTEQGDLKFVINASQGDFPRIVIAPGDVSEAFYATAHAFNLAEKYQLPVIIVSDKFIGESAKTAEMFDQKKVKIERGALVTEELLRKNKNYKRFAFTASGVSTRSVPGQKGGICDTNSDEHDEFGYSTDDADVRKSMMEKRGRKLISAAKDMPDPVLYGPKNAEITLVGWGSTKGPVLEAMKALENEGKKVNFLHLVYVFPFPSKKVTDILKRAKKTVLVENNFTGQLGSLIRENTGIALENKLLKYDGRQFYPHEIYGYVSKIIKKVKRK